MPPQLVTGERLVKMETSLDYLKEQSDKTVATLESFIRTADTKYATKDEVALVRVEVTRTEGRLWTLVRDWSPIIGVAAIILIQMVK